MDQSLNLGFAVVNQSYRTPAQLVFRTPNRMMDLDRLRVLILRYALHMQVRGVTQDSCVVLDSNGMPPQAIALTLAASLLGARWINFSPTMPYNALGVTHVFSRRQPGPKPHPKFHQIDDTWSRNPAQFQEEVPLNRFPGYRSPSDVALLIGSSGTTGLPKYIPQTYQQVWNRISRRPLPRGTVASCMFPPLPWMGFMFYMQAILSGSTIVLAPNLERSAALGAMLVRGSPAQIDKLTLDAPPLKNKVRRVFAGGGAVSTTAIKRWFNYFEEVEIAYGSTEGGVGGRILLTEVSDDTDIAYKLDEDAEVQILDEAGNQCPPDVQGILRVRSPRTVLSYVGDVEETANESFKDGWFYPGDLASLTPEGRLRIHGRIKEQLNMGGVKASAAEIDAAACQAYGVRQAMSFDSENQTGITELHLMATLEPGMEPVSTAAEIRRQCQKLRGAILVPSAIYFVDEIPINDNGKFLRRAAREMTASMTPY